MGFVEGEAYLEDRLEGDLQHSCELRMLDDYDRRPAAARHRVVHAEHDDGLVDDDQLEAAIDESRRSNATYAFAA
jgi:hypothetical protein